MNNEDFDKKEYLFSKKIIGMKKKEGIRKHTYSKVEDKISKIEIDRKLDNEIEVFLKKIIETNRINYFSILLPKINIQI